MAHISTITSKLTQEDVNTFCDKYKIPGHLLPIELGPRDTIKDAPEGM